MQLVHENKSKAANVTGRFIDIGTIRRRVAKVKNRWSAETTRSRAIEGTRRRDELEALLMDYICDTEESEECLDLKQHGFSLVG